MRGDDGAVGLATGAAASGPSAMISQGRAGSGSAISMNVLERCAMNPPRLRLAIRNMRTLLDALVRARDNTESETRWTMPAQLEPAERACLSLALSAGEASFPDEDSALVKEIAEDLRKPWDELVWPLLTYEYGGAETLKAEPEVAAQDYTCRVATVLTDASVAQLFALTMHAHYESLRESMRDHGIAIDAIANVRHRAVGGEEVQRLRASLDTLSTAIPKRQSDSASGLVSPASQGDAAMRAHEPAPACSREVASPNPLGDTEPVGAVLRDWSGITAALGLDNDRPTQKRLKRLNDKGGPITWPGEGRKPVVTKADLIPWWNRVNDAAFVAGEEAVNQRDGHAEVNERDGARAVHQLGMQVRAQANPRTD